MRLPAAVPPPCRHITPIPPPISAKRFTEDNGIPYYPRRRHAAYGFAVSLLFSKAHDSEATSSRPGRLVIAAVT